MKNKLVEANLHPNKHSILSYFHFWTPIIFTVVSLTWLIVEVILAHKKKQVIQINKKKDSNFSKCSNIDDMIPLDAWHINDDEIFKSETTDASEELNFIERFNY